MPEPSGVIINVVSGIYAWYRREIQDRIYHDSLIMGIRKNEFAVDLDQRDGAKSYQE